MHTPSGPLLVHFRASATNGGELLGVEVKRGDEPKTRHVDPYDLGGTRRLRHSRFRRATARLSSSVIGTTVEGAEALGKVKRRGTGCVQGTARVETHTFVEV